MKYCLLEFQKKIVQTVACVKKKKKKRFHCKNYVGSLISISLQLNSYASYYHFFWETLKIAAEMTWTQSEQTM